MKQLIAALAAAALCASPVYAQGEPKGEQKKEPADEQKRLQQCHAEAKNKKFKDGDERQAFMSACRDGTYVTRAEKLAACNKQAAAKGVSGDDRKKFVRQCLSG